MQDLTATEAGDRDRGRSVARQERRPGGRGDGRGGGSVLNTSPATATAAASDIFMLLGPSMMELMLAASPDSTLTSGRSGTHLDSARAQLCAHC